MFSKDKIPRGSERTITFLIKALHSKFYFSCSFELKCHYTLTHSPHVRAVLCSCHETVRYDLLRISGPIYKLEKTADLVLWQQNSLPAGVICSKPFQTARTKIRTDRTSGVIWFQTVRHSDCIADIFFEC